jgi:glucosylceramidase
MNNFNIKTYLYIFLLTLMSCNINNNDGMVKPDPVNVTNDIDVWLTRHDQSSLLEKQTSKLPFAPSTNNYQTIEIDSTNTFQSIDGFGFSLTGGSAMLINKMSSFQRNNLLDELFLCTTPNACISYLRISVGASDLDEEVFSYDDIPVTDTDLQLKKFSLSKDTMHLIPVLKSILKINPAINIMASPWSAPSWMKSNKNSIGGSLLTEYYQVYANYFVKYIQEMKRQGIPIDAVTVQNEPQHGGNNPSMVMSAFEQANFVKNHLGPGFKAAGLDTKIIIWDHNCDNPQYPISILNDAKAKEFINGSAFHLYGGDVSAMSTVRNAHPDKSLYFTEQWTSGNGSFGGDLRWHTRNVVIGSLRNWSRVVLEWNLANDPGYRPHTPGGCTLCKGAITIDGNIYQKNVSYYIISHASTFIPPGSVRIQSSETSNLQTVAFKTPQGKKVLLVLNDTPNSEIFNLKFHDKKALTSLPSGSVATYVWN